MEEKLKKLAIGNPVEFTEIFCEWIDNHDDEDITCQTDVVESLLAEFEENRGRAD